MSINHHKLYLDNVFALAGTLVIKSEYSAQCINNRLISKLGASSVDESQPQTWKYYMNICGEYHPTDEPIMIRSLDTLQMIPFTKTNLLVHTATARAYRYGSRYYRELVLQYPELEPLILGVLYPSEMSYALSSPDTTILAYPNYLVEENEENLISEMNNWIQKWAFRWHVSGFHESDELYGAAFLGCLYAQLIPLIISTRLRNCRTPFVHSYHIRQYLASHGMLDSYLAHLTHKQALFFYRNAMYLERHAGKASTFEWLVEKVMTDRGLPLVEYEMRHNTNHLLTDLRPEPVFINEPLNNIVSKSNTQISTAALLAKEIPDAQGNMEYVSHHAQDIENKLKYSLHAIAKTKVLESSLVQNTETSAHSLQDTALSMWGYYAATNRYPVYVRIKNPVSGEEMTLSTLQAYYYFFYAYCAVHSVKLQTVPPVYAQAIPRSPLPTLAEVMNHVDTKYVTEETVMKVMALSPPALHFVNSDLFKEGVELVFSIINQQAALVAREEHFYARGLLHAAHMKLYSDYMLRPAGTGDDIVQYFTNIDIPTTGFTDLEWQQIYMDLFQACTGFDIQATIQASDVQKAMIRLMTQLSSYSIQFVSELTGSNIQSFNWAAIRFGDNSGASRSYFEIIIAMLEWFGHKSDVKMYLPVPVLPTSIDFRLKLKPIDLGMLEIPVDIWISDVTNRARLEAVIDVGNFSFDDSYDTNADPELGNRTVFNALTEEQVRQIRDIYSSKCRMMPVTSERVSLSSVITFNQLKSFKPRPAKRFTLPSWKAFFGPKSLRYFADENNIIVLDGIWYFGGDDEVEAFKPSFGATKLETFKYTGSANGAEYSPVSFTYTGGLGLFGTFVPGPTADDFVLSQPFVQGIPVALPEFVTDSKVIEVTHVNPVTLVADGGALIHSYEIYQFSLDFKYEEFNMSPLVTYTTSHEFEFSQLPERVEITSMNYFAPEPVVVNNLVNNTGVLTPLDFTTGFVFDLGDLDDLM